ncbi:hypothetical protein FNF31_05977 [Cafeteria roenbergensis]|uniref:Uncharacterized protein n=1 Tax=Cafeteria roenbergensis TaxID=33653 RepID=A0A5A8CSQ7_CAFRO|nr:hypothetical protein FNF31_05977 [Cafeteria roenbergensis]KAA0159064.1 hypothetical protein FNF28_06001 [Cafeteria roenbergensis]
MPFFELTLSMAMDGVSKVAFSEGEGWPMMLKCTRCGHVGDKVQRVSSVGEAEMSGSRGVANHVQTCKECRAEFSVNVADAGAGAGIFDETNDESSPALITVIECRGCEPEPASFDGQGFTATSIGGATMDGVLEDGEWADYDVEAECEMALMEVSTAWALCAAPGKGKGRRRA